MRKITLFILLLVAAVSYGNTPPLAINATNFPDAIFRAYVSKNFDTNNDEILSEDEILAVTSINVGKLPDAPDNQKIKALNGIEYFVNLTALDCNYNQLTTLDVSQNTALTYLYCNSNQLTTLDVSQNNELTHFWCKENQFTTLGVSHNSKLKFLVCDNNQLATLDVNKNSALSGLSCFENRLTTLDVSQNTELRQLYCGNNRLTTLDVSLNSKLWMLNCSNNPNLSVLKIKRGQEFSNLHYTGAKILSDNDITWVD